MLKIVFMLFMLFDLATAASYRFVETRYSDAIDRSVERSGIIDFETDGLSVEYKKTDESLSYKDDTLLYTKDGKKTTFDEDKTQNLKNYFKLLILIHNGDDSELGDMFDVVKQGEMTTLTPDGEIKHYISKIVLIKNGKKIKSIQLFLANKDRVKIVIEDEIH
jgi:hypothetical protein